MIPRFLYACMRFSFYGPYVQTLWVEFLLLLNYYIIGVILFIYGLFMV
jgi:hypothetical protein